ncbi:MAG: hypothetical protein R2774_11565 [Saprospiraceae bacterium]
MHIVHPTFPLGNLLSNEHLAFLNSIFHMNNSVENQKIASLSEQQLVDIEIALLDRIDPKNLGNKVIAATLKRYPGYNLIIHKDFYNPTADWRLQSKTRVLVPNKLLAVQIATINPNVDVVITSREDMEDNLAHGTFHSMVMDTAYDTRHLVDKYMIVAVNPEELTPPAGQGTYVIIADKENLNLRKMAVQWHDASISLITNVERKVAVDTLNCGHIHISQNQNNYQVTFATLKDDVLIKKTLNLSSIATLNSFISNYI